MTDSFGHVDRAKAEAETLAQSLVGSRVVVAARSADEGRLFGSIGVRDVAAAICAAVGVDESLIQPVRDRPAHDRRYAIDPSRAVALGFDPGPPIEERMRSVVDWYRSHRAWWERIKAGEYRNYYERMYGAGGRYRGGALRRAAEEADQLRRAEVLVRRVTEVFPAVEDFGLLTVFRRVYRTGEIGRVVYAEGEYNHPMDIESNASISKGPWGSSPASSASPAWRRRRS